MDEFCGGDHICYAFTRFAGRSYPCGRGCLIAGMVRRIHRRTILRKARSSGGVRSCTRPTGMRSCEQLESRWPHVW